MALNGASVGGMLFTPLWALLIGQVGFTAAAMLIGVVMTATADRTSGRATRPA